MRNFLLSSIVFLMVGCKSSPPPISDSQVIPNVKTKYNFPFTDNNVSYLYKTSANIYGHYLSGLLLIKPLIDDNYRIVFTNELGVKFFDVEFVDSKFKTHFVMKKLDRKPVLKILENDFRLLLGIGLTKKLINEIEKQGEVRLQFMSGKERVQYQFYSNPFILQSCQTFSKTDTKKSSIFFTNSNGGIPDTIKINHHTIKLDIELNFLNR